MKTKFNIFEKKDRKHFKVIIFGSARINSKDGVYKKVKVLAEMLGERGLDVVTGGGPGLMQAANEGHRAGNRRAHHRTHSIGIGVKMLWNQKFNESVQYKTEFNRFSRRLDEFMLLSNAIVVAPGGLGTMLELFYAWQLVQVHNICHIPIILMGKRWQGLLKWIKKEGLLKKYLGEEDYEIVFCVEKPEEAIKIIEESYKAFRMGGKDFCLNYKKYKI